MYNSSHKLTQRTLKYMGVKGATGSAREIINKILDRDSISYIENYLQVNFPQSVSKLGKTEQEVAEEIIKMISANIEGELSNYLYRLVKVSET